LFQESIDALIYDCANCSDVPLCAKIWQC